MRYTRQLLTLFLCFFLVSAFAEESPQDKADFAVANILFDYSEGEEFASYRIDEYGYAHITFALNIPDKLYNEILTSMQVHPDIPDVIFDKGGPRCKLW